MDENGRDPGESLFLSQNLPAKTLHITQHAYDIMFISCTFAFILFGIVLILNIANAYSVSIEYGNVCPINSVCSLEFEVKLPMAYPISVNYELRNFYQNHYHSIHSRSDRQLEGQYVRYDDMKRCAPFRAVNDDPSPNHWILPCGVQAVSIFNDSFEVEGLGTLLEPPKPQSGIDPSPLNTNYLTGNKWLDDAAPKTGLTYRRLGVWMDTAAFSDFRRIWGITQNQNSKQYFAPGNYTIRIQNNYDVSSIGGRKFVVLTPRTSILPSGLLLGLIFIGSGGVIGLVTASCMISQRMRSNHRCSVC